MANQIVLSDAFKELIALSLGSDGADKTLEAALYGANDSPPYISIRDQQFTFIEGDREWQNEDNQYIDFSIALMKAPVTRTYYEGDYDPKVPGPPTCSSFDGVTPDVTSPKARSCAVCPLSKWGSATSKKTGEQIMACREHRELVIKPVNVDSPFVLRVPPASRKNWQTFAAQIGSVAKKERAAGAPVMTMNTIIVRASFAGTGVLSFKAVGYITEKEALGLVQIMKDPDKIKKFVWGPAGADREAKWLGAPQMKVFGEQKTSGSIKFDPPAETAKPVDAVPEKVTKPRKLSKEIVTDELPPAPGRRISKAEVTERPSLNVDAMLSEMGMRFEDPEEALDEEIDNNE